MLLLVAVGCGKNIAGPTAKDLKAFDSAPSEVKQMWDKASEADKTNDYATAETLLYAILRSEPSPDQREAATRKLTAVTQRLDSALEKGDPAAQAALEELRRNPPNRPH